MAVNKASTVANTSLSAPICGGLPQPASNKQNTITDLVVFTNCLPAIACRESHPRIRIDVLADEPHRAIAKQHVGSAWMLRPHFIGMPKRIVGSMNNHLRMIANIRPAMHAHQAATTVAIGRPGPHIKSRAGSSARHHTYPGLVAQDRTMLTEENGLAQPVSN